MKKAKVLFLVLVGVLLMVGSAYADTISYRTLDEGMTMLAENTPGATKSLFKNIDMLWFGREYNWGSTAYPTVNYETMLIFPITTNLEIIGAGLHVYPFNFCNDTPQYVQYVKGNVGNTLDLADFDLPRDDVFNFMDDYWTSVVVKNAVLDAKANNWNTIGFAFTGKELGIHYSEIVPTGKYGSYYWPSLNLDVVPEPSSFMGLFSLMSSMLIMGYKKIMPH
jgi:hypothetical protein